MAAPPLIDLESALPLWARCREAPPTHSDTTRVEIFDDLTSRQKLIRFQVSSGRPYYQKASLTCGICEAMLYMPACCDRGCGFLACLPCLEAHNGFDPTCPSCRCVRNSAPEVAKHLLPIVDEEIASQGVLFECNVDRPGAHETAMWCCDRKFNSLTALRQHFVERGSFFETRVAVVESLKKAVGGDPEAQLAIFQDPLRSQAALVLEENTVWQASMLERLDFTENNCRAKRPRRGR